MSSERMWMVRAGEGAYLIDDFRSKKIVAIGWDRITDLSRFKTPEEIKNLLKKTYPDYKKGKIIITSGQFNRFRFEFNKGDKVVSYDPEKRVYLIGEITSDYIYDNNLLKSHHNHIREVKWLGNVDRDVLSTSTKNTLGAISTIFEIGNDAKNEIMNVLQGKHKPVEDVNKNDEELDILKEDMESKSHEFIKDKFVDLNWEEMQELVAGLLRAMGYKTIISPKGSDRGKDIQASPDGLGLENPRIKVEVKHRSGQMGSKEIRGFVGGLRPGDKSLFVSTGGFTKDAKYEAERSNTPVTLIDSDLLVKMVIQYYDKFDPETRSLIPLTKIYWPT